MIIRPVKTQKVLANTVNMFELLDKYLPTLSERSVVAITSKVVALCEGRVIPIGKVDKQHLIAAESDYYLPSEKSRHNLSFTIIHNTLVPMAGIDESNGNGNYVLWPVNPQKSANDVRAYLKKRFGIKHVGVVITDSTAMPLHWGTKGIGIRYSGFKPTNDYIGQSDLFGRPFAMSKSNIADSLAAAAVLVMGEGTEQTPVAVVEDVPFVNFVDKNPTKKELDGFYITHLNDDLFAPLLKNAPWVRGGRGKNRIKK